MTPITNETLQAEKLLFETLKNTSKRAYDKKAMPAVLQALKEYKATGKYPYNAQVKDYILTNNPTTINASLHDYLETEVYLAQCDLRAEAKQKQQQDMAEKGYMPTSQLNGYIGNAELVAEDNIFKSKLATTGKIITAGNGEPFFVPKGKRTRGYYIKNLDNAFYKAI